MASDIQPRTAQYILISKLLRKLAIFMPDLRLGPEMAGISKQMARAHWLIAARQSEINLILLSGKAAKVQENHHGQVHGALDDRAGTQNAQLCVRRS